MGFAFDEILVCQFSDMPEYLEAGGANPPFANDGPRRIPYKVLTAHSFPGNEWPYVVETPFGPPISTSVRGLHNNPNPGAPTATQTVVRHLHGEHRTKGDLMSWIMVRLTNGQNVDVAPACKIDNIGNQCYSLHNQALTASLGWTATGLPGGQPGWRGQIVRYTSAGDTAPTTVGGGSWLEIPANQPTTQYTYWAIGIRCTEPVSGGVTLTAYAQLLVGGLNGGLSSIVKNTTPTGVPHVVSPSVSQASGLLWNDGFKYAGIKWRPSGSNSLTSTRIVMAWGAFQLFDGTGATQPVPPVLTLSSTEGTKIHAVASAFFDSDSSDSHVKTRWLLYEAEALIPYPIIDTDFQGTNLNSITFEDLAPGKHYAVRCQFLDNEAGGGDISPLSAFTHIETFGQPTWYLSGIAWTGRSAGGEFPRNNAHSYYDAALQQHERVWQFVNDGESLGSVGPVVTRFDRGSAWSQPFRRIAYTDPAAHNFYNFVMATMVFLKWTGDTKLRIGTRCTAHDAHGFYVRKVHAGGNYTYHVEERTLIGTNSNSTNPADWTNVPVIPPITIPAGLVGLSGERVILTSNNLGQSGSQTASLALYVNGMLLGAVSGPTVAAGVGDPSGGHDFSALMMEDGIFGDFLISQIGQMAGVPAFPIIVRPSTDTTGSGMHRVGPFMDAFDSAVEVGGIPNVWFMGGGKFRFRTGAAAGDVSGLGFLVYWAPALPSYDYAVKSKFYSMCGPVVRFTNPSNYIAVTVSSVVGSNYTYSMVFVEGGLAVAVYQAVVVDPNYATVAPEIVVQVANNAFNIGQIYVRVYYNGTAMDWGGFGEAVHVERSPGSALLIGRFGVVRSHIIVAAGNDIPVCEAIECFAGQGSAAPNMPMLIGHDNELCAKISFRLTSSAFSDPDPGATHTASEWEVHRHPAGTLLWKSGTDVANLTAITITPGMGSWFLIGAETPGFDTNTAYKARVRHRDNLGLWSPWSAFHQFTTSIDPGGTVAIPNLPTYPSEPLVSQTFEETVQFNTLISLSENGKEQRRAKWTVPRRLFKLRYDIRIQAEIDVIWNFYRSVGFGRLNLFNFVDPRGGNHYICRFLEDGLTRELIEFQIENTGLSLIEVPV